MNGYGYPRFDNWDGAIDLHRLAHRNRLNINAPIRDVFKVLGLGLSTSVLYILWDWAGSARLE